MQRKMKRLSVLLVLVFMLQSILMPAVYAQESDNVVMEITIPQLTLTNARVSLDSIELVWASNDSSIKASIYDVYRDNSLIKTVEGFTYTDSGLSPQTKYTYAVKAKNANGEVISESNTLSATTAAEAIKPDTSLKVTDAAISIEQSESAKNGEILKVGNPDFKTDRFIIKYKNEDSKKLAAKIDSNTFKDDLRNSRYKADSLNNSFGRDIELVTLNEAKTLREFAEVLEKNNVADDIEFVQPDYQLGLFSNDQYYDSQWGVENNTDTERTSEFKIGDRLERLPPHLSYAIERNPKLKEFLKNISVMELREKLLSGNVPEYADPHILMEIAFEVDSMGMAVEAPTDQTNEQTYKCDAGVSEAWNDATGEGVIVAVIDTGIDTTHEDLAKNIWVNKNEIPDNSIDDDGNGKIDDVSGWNFSDNSNIVNDSTNFAGENHGTNLAGIISAAKDNQKGIAGVAPSAKVMPLKVFVNGKAYTSDVINAIQYAESMGVKIVNCSWGSTDDNPALKEAIQKSGMLFVCAAGNSGSDIDNSPVYPAAFDCQNIITVASVNRNGCLSSFSNFGQNSVDVAAPGEGIYSTFPGNQYGENSGTSIAAAFVSGEAALLLSYSGSMSATEIKERIVKYSEHLSSLTGKVNGIAKINCLNSINDLTSKEIINIPDYTQIRNINVKASSKEANNQSLSLYSTAPVEGRFIKIASGHNFGLALRSDGKVWAWGYNYYGQLGDGTTTDRSSPVQVIGLSDIKAISAGDNFSMALRSDGTVWTWGLGILENGTIQKRTIPVQVNGLNGITEIDGGGSHYLALRNDGTVWTWGNNNCGQLGDTTKTTRSNPVCVSGLSEIKAISGGSYHSLALKKDGTVWAWGMNGFGQLGDGTTMERVKAVRVSGLSEIINIHGGSSHSIALKSDGSVWTWGYNIAGQLGDGTTEKKISPIKISTLNGVTGICGMDYNSLALKKDGTVLAWGDNHCGQLGNGTTINSASPVEVSGLSEITQVDAGNCYCIALKKDGTVWTWGDNSNGKLGDGSGISFSKYAKYSFGTPASELLTVACTANCTSGNIFKLALKLKNMKSISDRTFTITYNPSDISEVIDLCKLTYKEEKTTGTIAGTGITILKNEPGTIIFSIDKDIPENKSWSGIVNVIEFKPAVGGQVTFNCKVE